MSDKSTEAAADKLAGAGREGGGESGGGAYADKDQARGDSKLGGVMGHGGQSEISYHGDTDKEASDDNPNAATK